MRHSIIFLILFFETFFAVSITYTNFIGVMCLMYTVGLINEKHAIKPG